MNKPTIIITGAGGFIGEYLTNYFSKKGHNIKALLRSIPTNRKENVDYFEYALETEPDDQIFHEANYLIHCAFIKFEKNNNSDEINFRGTKYLIEKCRKFNVKIFYSSSFSAHEKAESHYGKSKLACEKLFDISKDVILKTGFVIGENGMAYEIIKYIEKFKIVPLIGGGKQPIQTIFINDLSLIIEKIFVQNKVGVFNLAENKAITMKTFYLEIARLMNKKVYFVNIPLNMMYLCLKFVEILNIKLPITSESVLGLKQLKVFETSKDLETLGVDFKNYKESLKEILVNTTK